MKTLFFAEKPSVGKEYKEMLENLENQIFNKNDGYFESEKYYVSWGYGHLISLADPADYGWGEWSLDNLPMIPSDWKYLIKDDPGAKKQFKTILELLKKSNTVVNGADPDREGELIFRLILHVSGRKDIQQFRFWNRSMTMTDLISAWNSKKNAKEYNNLYAAANCRQRADWLVGMNLSRVYSIKSGSRGISVGRVQTPTLAMIVNRDREIENWTRAFFSELHIKWNSLEFTYVGTSSDSKTTLEFVEEGEKTFAQFLAESLNNEVASVASLQKTVKNQHPPLMFNLADLQKEANKNFKLTADQTLQAAQSLYEKKLLSYPRTDCNYLTVDMADGCRELLYKLISTEQNTLISQELPKSFNSEKVTAHTALVPVSIPSTELSGNERIIYSIVVNRFISAFGKPKKINVTNLQIKAGEHFFNLNHNYVTDFGFELLFKKNEDKTEKNFPFPIDINETTVSKIEDVLIVEKERSKPKHYTESSLLSSMENCSKTISDLALRDALKSAEGIGTPATRSSIIESLKKRGYIIDQKNNLISTEKGRSVIDVVVQDVSSPELTASWESKLSLIESGELNWKEFYDGICHFTKNIVETVINDSVDIKISSDRGNYLVCPKCKSTSLMVNKGGAFCKQEPCDFKLFKKQYGKELSDSSFQKLLLKGKSGKQKFKNKEGKEYAADLVLDKTFNVKLSF